MRWRRRANRGRLLDFHDLLDSAQEGLAFSVGFRIQWRPARKAPDSDQLDARAGRLVRVPAEALAHSSSVLRPQALEQDINARLLDLLPLRGEAVLVLGARVTVSVDPATRTIGEQFAQAQQQARLEDLSRRQTAARMAFMRSQVLQDPASARIYLLMENSVQHGGLPPGTDIDEIVRQVQQWHPQSRWVVTAQLLHAFIGDLTPTDTDDLVNTLRSLFGMYSRDDLAEQLPAPEPKAQP